jgi:YHS domain-containing protein
MLKSLKILVVMKQRSTAYGNIFCDNEYFFSYKNACCKKIVCKMIIFLITIPFCCMCTSEPLMGEELSQADQEVQKEKLMPLQDFIGGWKGVAMQKLGGSSRWSAESEWAWSFDEGVPAIVFELTPGRYFTSGRIVPGKEDNMFVLEAKHTESEAVETFTGFIDENQQLELVNDVIEPNRPARLLIKTLADNKRLVLTLQYGLNIKRLQQGATLGYTRKGTVFATRSRPLNECVVTGGEGNQQVSYQGETYWVCCKGCLSMFEDNPEKVIAAYKARKAKERAKQQSQ